MNEYIVKVSGCGSFSYYALYKGEELVLLGSGERKRSYGNLFVCTKEKQALYHAFLAGTKLVKNAAYFKKFLKMRPKNHYIINAQDDAAVGDITFLNDGINGCYLVCLHDKEYIIQPDKDNKFVLQFFSGQTAVAVLERRDFEKNPYYTLYCDENMLDAAFIFTIYYDVIQKDIFSFYREKEPDGKEDNSFKPALESMTENISNE